MDAYLPESKPMRAQHNVTPSLQSDSKNLQHCDFITTGKQADSGIAWLNQLYQSTQPTHDLDKEAMVSALVQYRFEFTHFYVSDSFLSQVHDKLMALPELLIYFLYRHRVIIFIDAIMPMPALCLQDSPKIYLAEKILLDDEVFHTAENPFMPYGLSGILGHEIGHAVDWLLDSEGFLSDLDSFQKAWSEDVEAIPPEMKPGLEALNAMIQRYGRTVDIPKNESFLLDLHYYLDKPEEVFAEVFLCWLLGPVNEPLSSLFPRSLESGVQILKAAFQKRVNKAASPSKESVSTEDNNFHFISYIEHHRIAWAHERQSHSMQETDSAESYSESQPEVCSPEEFSKEEPQYLPQFLLVDSDVYDSEALVGGKAEALGALFQLECPMPRWCVLLPDAFYDSLDEAQSSEWTVFQSAETLDEEAFNVWLRSVTPSQRILEELSYFLQYLCPNGERVAVRSSAADEDGAVSSYAGVLESFLYVSPDEVKHRITDIWRSGFSARIRSYRHSQGITELPSPPAVIIQQMVPSTVAGVAFGADPVSGNPDPIVISAVFGLGTTLVSGETNADRYILDSQGTLLSQQIATKTVADYAPATPEENNPQRITLEASVGNQATLNQEQALVVAMWVRYLGDVFGEPQDVEWAIAEDETVYLLQSRPITSLPQWQAPRYEAIPHDTFYNVLDRGLLIDSYGGVTLPLSYSLNRLTYGAYYRNYIHQVSIPKPGLKNQDWRFEHLLSLIQGRIYTNTTTMEEIWFYSPSVSYLFEKGKRLTKSLCQPFVFGKKAESPDEIKAKDVFSHWINFSKGLTCIIQRISRLKQDKVAFHQRVNQHLQPIPRDISTVTTEFIREQILQLTHLQCMQWQAPVLNDYVMKISFALLKQMGEDWCDDSQGTFCNSLLNADAQSISSQLHRALTQLAEIASRDPEWVNTLCEGSLEDIQSSLETSKAFQKAYEDYISSYGDRCQEDHKLESLSIQEDPLPLFRSIGLLARKNGNAAIDSEIKHVERKTPDLIHEALMQKLPHAPLKRWIMGIMARTTQGYFWDKENMRFESTRVMSAMRRLFNELDRRLVEARVLEQRRDIFWLTLDEAVGFMEGTTATVSLRKLVTLRQAEYATYQTMPPLQLALDGMIHLHNDFTTSSDITAAPTGDALQGIACCSGLVQGEVHFVTQSTNPADCNGKLLVAEHCDPGLITLFPLVRGLLFEHGDPLCHSAIVARELGIPTIVGIAGLQSWLKEGDSVTLNGASGWVEKIKP